MAAGVTHPHMDRPQRGAFIYDEGLDRLRRVKLRVTQPSSCKIRLRCLAKSPLALPPVGGKPQRYVSFPERCIYEGKLRIWAASKSLIFDGTLAGGPSLAVVLTRGN